MFRQMLFLNTHNPDGMARAYIACLGGGYLKLGDLCLIELSSNRRLEFVRLKLPTEYLPYA